MASYVDPLVVGRVIGEVVDLFVPTMSMSVSYGTKHVNNGCDVKPSMAINPPTVQIAGRRADLYTLVSMALYIPLVVSACIIWCYTMVTSVLFGSLYMF